LFIVRQGEFLVLADCTAGRLARGEPALRRRQMECALNPARRLEAARSIVEAKLQTLKLAPVACGIAVDELAKASTLQDVLICEAEHASVYWRRWRGRELIFKGDYPPEWTVFKARPRSWRTGRLGENGRQFSNRFALHPVNAMLNYAGAIVVAQCARTLAGIGLDPALGVLHSTARECMRWHGMCLNC
jgi:CRISPR/Cas system-associated endonuclease Cas1